MQKPSNTKHTKPAERDIYYLRFVSKSEPRGQNLSRRSLFLVLVVGDFLSAPHKRVCLFSLFPLFIVLVLFWISALFVTIKLPLARGNPLNVLLKTVTTSTLVLRLLPLFVAVPHIRPCRVVL